MIVTFCYFVVRGGMIFVWISSLGLLKDGLLVFSSSFPPLLMFSSSILCKAGFVERYLYVLICHRISCVFSLC